MVEALLIKPELDFVYEAAGDLDAPREIGQVYDGTRRIIPILTGGYVKGHGSAAVCSATPQTGN